LDCCIRIFLDPNSCWCFCLIMMLWIVCAQMVIHGSFFLPVWFPNPSLCLCMYWRFLHAKWNNVRQEISLVEHWYELTLHEFCNVARIMYEY
jgi:hypothetical protein